MLCEGGVEPYVEGEGETVVDSYYYDEGVPFVEDGVTVAEHEGFVGFLDDDGFFCRVVYGRDCF